MKRFMRKHRIHTLDELTKRSIDDMEWFWDACAKDLKIEWFKPYKKVLDTSKGIEWARWFIGGKLNIAHNCTDRHAGTRGDKTASSGKAKMEKLEDSRMELCVRKSTGSQTVSRA